MALVFGTPSPGYYGNTSGGTATGGTTSGGSTSTGGSRTRAARTETPLSLQFEDVTEVGLSSEASVTLTTGNQTARISWQKFAGALGYRIFRYRKSLGERVEQKYYDVGRESLAFQWPSDEGAQDGGPQNVGRFNVTPTAVCTRHVDLNGNPAEVQHAAPYVKSLLKTAGGETDDKLNTESFETFNAGFAERIKRYIPQQITIGGLVSEVEATTMGYLKADEDSRHGLYLVDQNKAPVMEFFDEDFVNPPMQAETQRGNTYNKVTVDFDQDALTQALKTVSVEVPEASEKYTNNQEFQLSSIAVDRVANTWIADMISQTLKRQMPMLIITVRSKGFAVSVGDIIAITCSRGFTPTGTYNGDRWFVSSVTRNLEKATVEFLCTKPWDDFEKANVWADDAVAVFADADTSEKETYAFWHDDTNYIDATTSKHSVWSPR